MRLFWCFVIGPLNAIDLSREWKVREKFFALKEKKKKGTQEKWQQRLLGNAVSKIDEKWKKKKTENWSTIGLKISQATHNLPFILPRAHFIPLYYLYWQSLLVFIAFVSIVLPLLCISIVSQLNNNCNEIEQWWHFSAFASRTNDKKRW